MKKDKGNTEEATVKKIMIATPCHDGKLPVEYVGALLDTMRAGIPAVIAPVFLPGESMLPHARNYLAQMFLDSDFDVLMYIDADMVWSPEQFARIALSEAPVMSAAAHLKKENSPLNFRELSGEKPSKEGILSVESVGAAFIKLDRHVVVTAVKDSDKYTVHNGEYPSLFEYSIVNGELIGEDIGFCRKIRRRKTKVLVDLNVVVGHIGTKIY